MSLWLAVLLEFDSFINQFVVATFFFFLNVVV